MKKANVTTLKINDISYLMGISTDEVKKLIRNNEFPVMIYRGTIRVPAEAFYKWYEYNCWGGAA